MTQAEMIRRLADRQAIEDTIARYARGVDRRDWDLVRSTYHPDATDGTARPETVDRESYLRRAMGRPLDVEWLGVSIWKRRSVVFRNSRLRCR